MCEPVSNKDCVTLYFHINLMVGCACDKFPQGVYDLSYLSSYLCLVIENKNYTFPGVCFVTGEII